MKPITKAQRAALKRVFDRTPLLSRKTLPPNTHSVAPYTNVTPNMITGDLLADWQNVTYRRFRRSVVGPLYRSDPCLMVPWCGMWLGIEADGYTHS